MPPRVPTFLPVFAYNVFGLGYQRGPVSPVSAANASTFLPVFSCFRVGCVVSITRCDLPHKFVPFCYCCGALQHAWWRITARLVAHYSMLGYNMFGGALQHARLQHVWWRRAQRVEGGNTCQIDFSHAPPMFCMVLNILTPVSPVHRPQGPPGRRRRRVPACPASREWPVTGVVLPMYCTGKSILA